jgi:putative ABC transport system permease protein
MSFVLVKTQAGKAASEVAQRISAATGLRAVSRTDFGWMTILYYIRFTGIPINFGLTVAVALIVGTVVAGQTFYIFTLENLKQFGALKAIGTTNWRIVRMILLQASLAGVIGYSIGMGLAATFFEIASRQEALRGMTMPWQVMAGAGVLVMVIVSVASVMSIRKVVQLEPAVVFRG